MSFLALPAERDEVSDLDMILWVDKYLQPDKIGISGHDLWEVRCQLLNQRLDQRQAVHAGKVREVLFAWGKYSIGSGLELRPGSRWHRILMIRADELYKALFRAADTFCDQFIRDPENLYTVNRRLNQVFGAWKPPTDHS